MRKVASGKCQVARRKLSVARTVALLLLATCHVPLATASPCSTLAGCAKTIFIFVQAGRSFDQYFGDFPSAAGSTNYTYFNGQTLGRPHCTDTPGPTGGNVNTQTWDKMNQQVNGNQMNAWEIVHQHVPSNGQLVIPCQYISSIDLPNYRLLSNTYVLADHFFSAAIAPDFVAGEYAIGGAASPSAGVAFIDQPSLSANASAGCDCWNGGACVAGDMTAATQLRSALYPCWAFGEILEALSNAGVTVHIYSTAKNTAGWAENSFTSDSTVYNGFHNGPDTWNSVGSGTLTWKNISTFDADAAAGTVGQVNFVFQTAVNQEGNSTSTCSGENAVVDNVANIMANATLWNDVGGGTGGSVIFWFHKNTGEFADHLPMTKVDEFGPGPRVPLGIWSPWADHANHAVYTTATEPASILKFLESRFSLSNLGGRDANSSLDNLTGAFNFSQTPLGTVTLNQRTCTNSAILPLSPNPSFVGGIGNGLALTNVGSVSAATTITYTNQSGGSIVIPANAVTAVGDAAFTADTCSSQTVTNGNTCTVGVEFAPTAAGNMRWGYVRLTIAGLQSSPIDIPVEGSAAYASGKNPTQVAGIASTSSVTGSGTSKVQ